MGLLLGSAHLGDEEFLAAFHSCTLENSQFHHADTFVIAHRLSTVRRATQIVVLDNGAIVERGTFDELLQQRGFFHQLYARQFAAHAGDRSDERPVQRSRSR